MIKDKYFNYILIFYALLMPLGQALQNIGILILFLYWIISYIKLKALEVCLEKSMKVCLGMVQWKN